MGGRLEMTFDLPRTKPPRGVALARTHPLVAGFCGGKGGRSGRGDHAARAELYHHRRQYRPAMSRWICTSAELPTVAAPWARWRPVTLASGDTGDDQKLGVGEV